MKTGINQQLFLRQKQTHFVLPNSQISQPFLKHFSLFLSLHSSLLQYSKSFLENIKIIVKENTSFVC